MGVDIENTPNDLEAGQAAEGGDDFCPSKPNISPMKPPETVRIINNI
jgi:hypothetical protein